MFRFSLLLIVLAVLPAQAADPVFTAKLEKLDAPETVAEPIRKLLAPEALVVSVENGDVVMKVWFRKEIPVKASAEQIKNGLTYREIPEGEIVGVIQFPVKFTDYRRQEIAAGVYTLRFAVQPDIGDHTGTAPHPDFCLMCPIEKDKTAERIEKKKLIEVSSEVNEGKHPAVLLMYPNATKDAGPKVVGKGDGVWVVNLRRTVATEEEKSSLGFGITVAGMWKP